MTTLFASSTAGQRQAGARRSLRSWLLGRDEAASNFRLLLVMLYVGLVWLGAILVERPAVDLGLLGEQSNFFALLLRPFVSVLLAAVQPDVLRHLAIPLIMLGLGIRDGARYLDDLFELHNRGLARDFLLAAVFGMNYPTLEIKDGQVTEAGKMTSLYRIGGPGYLKVYLGNAALFERVAGKSKIYPPPPRPGSRSAGPGRHFVQSFDRLREVIDLRPQLRQPPNMEVYTKDGIQVKARDIEVIFRVWSEAEVTTDSSMFLTYPFSEQAVRRVVFGKTIGRDPQPAPWLNSLARMAANMVVEEIGKLRLQDLISQKQKIGAPRPVAPDAIDTGQAMAGAALNADEAENRRRALALSVLREDNLKRFEQNGVRVRFFDIGTLETPPEITQEFVNAWTGDRAARLQAGQISLPAKRAQSRGRQISEVINHIANYWLSKQKESDKGTTATDVLRMYHIKLTELYKNTRTGWPEKTEEALQYIHQLSRPITIGE